jgi:hypothetical protein
MGLLSDLKLENDGEFDWVIKRRKIDEKERLKAEEKMRIEEEKRLGEMGDPEAFAKIKIIEARLALVEAEKLKVLDKKK